MSDSKWLINRPKENDSNIVSSRFVTNEPSAVSSFNRESFVHFWHFCWCSSEFERLERDETMCPERVGLVQTSH